jgi:hypothetical protein
MCWEIAGPREEMTQPTLDMMNRLASVLGIQPGTGGDSNKRINQAA